MPSIFAVLTVISAVCFTLALVWVVALWVKVGEEPERLEGEIPESLERREGRSKRVA